MNERERKASARRCLDSFIEKKEISQVLGSAQKADRGEAARTVLVGIRAKGQSEALTNKEFNTAASQCRVGVGFSS